MWRSFNSACGRQTNLHATVLMQFSSHSLMNVTALKNDFVLQACDFLWTFNLLSFVAMFRYIQ